MMFIPNSPRPPSGITCSFLSDIRAFERMLDVRCWMLVKPATNHQHTKSNIQHPFLYWLRLGPRGLVAGSPAVMEVAAASQVGWPKPLALTSCPVPRSEVRSLIMLSPPGP